MTMSEVASFPVPRPAFRRLQLPYCKQRKAGRGTGNEAKSEAWRPEYSQGSIIFHNDVAIDGRHEIGIITALCLPSVYLTPLYMTTSLMPSPSILAYCMRVEVGVRLHDRTSKTILQMI